MKKIILLLTLTLSSQLTYSAPTVTQSVNREEFKRLVKILKQTMDRVEVVEKRNQILQQKINAGAGKSTPSVGADGAVDLNSMNSEAGRPPVGTASSAGSSGGAVQPTFKTYFDLALIMQPGPNNFSFDNFHQFLFFEIVPNPNLQFTFHIDPTPKYFELDYQLTKRVQIRAGRIWIPFDDLNPHTMFGGRINTSRIALGSTFLPDVWANLGIGVKITLIDSSFFSLLTHLYIVNGFRAGGTDPTTGVASNNYPNLSDTTTFPDNNRDKAIGGRAQAIIGGGHLNIGASFYTSRWSQESDDPARLIAVGLDAQIRFLSSELRAGLAGIISDLLPTGTTGFTRGGAYVEYGQRFGRNQDWKFLLRGGMVQLDSRVVAATDQMLAGGTLLYKPGPVEFSMGYSRDFRQVATKANYDLFIARVIMAF